MDFSKGLTKLRQSLNQSFDRDAQILRNEFEKVRDRLNMYVSDSAGAYKPLKDFSEVKDIPQKGNEPDGFVYGYEIIPSIKNPKANAQEESDNISFPLIHPFMKVGATAIEENGNCGQCFFNFALRSIISYPLRDCVVYMIDSNVSGDFNSLSPICSALGDTSEKNMFHYITTTQETDQVLQELTLVMDHNIRNYISKYPDLSSYNRQNPQMREPYHFLFIKNIHETLSSKQQIMNLAKLVYSQNATKAGIFIFFTYDNNVLSNQEEAFFSEEHKAIQYLLSISCVMEKPERHYPDANLSLEPKATFEIVNKVINYVDTQKPPVSVMTFSSMIKNKLASGSLWDPPYKGQKSHLYIPVGYQNATTTKEIDFNFRDSSPHTFIGGRTGSGKSILLHNIILNGALRYSPDKLQFYLADMKGGVSFVKYKQLPHVAALCASSDRHYVESLLELFCNEIDYRASLMKRANVTLLDDYNEMAEKLKVEKLPYLFCIIDEFQILFSSTDDVSNKSKKYIEKIHKLGRFEGIFLALCTQSAPSEVDRRQVGVKLSMYNNTQDSMALIGNEGAAYLRGTGRALYNPSETGESKYNQEFQVAYIDEKNELPQYVQQIHQIYLKQNNGLDKYDHLIYDDNDQSVKLSDNPVLSHPKNLPPSPTPYIYLGIPGFYRKEHVKFCFHRDSQSNVAICGNDRQAALRLVGIIVIQFMRFYKQRGAKVYISDLQKQTESTYNKLDFLGKNTDISHSDSTNLTNTLEEVYQILCQRKQDPANSVYEPEVLYSILDLKSDSNFTSSQSSMFSFSGTTEITPTNKLKELIEDGPDYGIHILAYSYNFANMDVLQNLSLLNKMEVKIALRGGNSSRLLINIGSNDIIDQFGKAYIRMPEDMGLKYNDGDSYGDPFLIYNTIGDRKFENSVWDVLFKKLPNKEY